MALSEPLSGNARQSLLIGAKKKKKNRRNTVENNKQAFNAVSRDEKKIANPGKFIIPPIDVRELTTTSNRGSEKFNSKWHD